MPFPRESLEIDPLELARLLLGSVLLSDGVDGRVGVRLTEVEAYCGREDPASHSYRGKTRRNEVMWGPAGHLYVYFIYGMHFCANVVGTRDGAPGAVLLRAGEVVEGGEIARQRKPRTRGAGKYAIGPAVLTGVLGIGREHNGADLTTEDSPVRLLPGDEVPSSAVNTGPRVGVTAAEDNPWRFWIDGSPAVSAYRRGGRRRPARE